MWNISLKHIKRCKKDTKRSRRIQNHCDIVSVSVWYLKSHVMSTGPISGDFNCNYLVKKVSASFPPRKFNIFPFYLVSSRAIFWYILKYFTHKCHVSYQNYPLVFTSIDISCSESSISKVVAHCLFSNFIISSTFISWNSYS